MAMAAILLVPAVATIWTAWQKFMVPVAPEPLALSLTGLGALIVNLSRAFLLARFRHHSGSPLATTRLRTLRSSAPDFVTAFLWVSAWPDLIVGLGIIAMNADAAREVWTAAREEHRAVA